MAPSGAGPATRVPRFGHGFRRVVARAWRVAFNHLHTERRGTVTGFLPHPAAKLSWALQNYVCFKSEIVRGVEEDPNKRARSFLFFGLGALAASGLGGAKLYVPENGLISFNDPQVP